MDWLKESQEMFQAWTESQKKTWEAWLKAVQGSDKSKPAEIWKKTIDAWQESVNGTLNAQVEGSQIWAKSVTSIEGAPKESADWAKQVQEMTKNWTEMQQQMWDNWFEIAKKGDPFTFAGGWDKEGPAVLKTWQDMAQKAMSSQSEWIRNWTALGQPKKES